MKSLSLADIEKLEQRYRAALINSITGLKSANLVGTQSSSGLSNLAIFSSCVHLGSSPALIGIISRPATTQRDSFENIKETGFFTINHVNRDIFKKAHQTSARYPKEVCEFNEVGLTKEYLNDFKAPFVKESHIKFALELVEIIPISINKTELVIGKVNHLYFPEDCLTSRGHLNIEKAHTVAVSGLDHYHETHSLASLSYAKPNQEIKVISSNS